MEVLVEVVRSGLVESRHRGIAVRVDPDGEELWSFGDPDAVIFPRSANKPFQALGMMRAGLPLDGPELAIAASIHSGEQFHLDAVRAVLGRAGLDESALQTPPSYPLDPTEHAAVLRAGGGRAPILMDCSGKHAAMLLTSVVNDWPTETYLDPDHPLQQQLRATVQRLAGETIAATGVDGCGAPLFAMSLAGLARSFVTIATASTGTPEHRVAEAIRAHPEWLGGTRRDVTALVAGIPGLVAKDGAEGVYAAALPDGRVVALKVDDGQQRARPPVMVAALRALGVDAPVLAELAETPLLGGGRPVGSVRAAFDA